MAHSIAITWIMVVTRQHAAIFVRSRTDGALTPLRELAAAIPDAYEIRSHDGNPSHRQPPASFMQDVADTLNEAFAQHEFSSLIITAPPSLLSIVRPLLDTPVVNAIITALPKTLHYTSPAQLAHDLRQSGVQAGF